MRYVGEINSQKKEFPSSIVYRDLFAALVRREGWGKGRLGPCFHGELVELQVGLQSTLGDRAVNATMAQRPRIARPYLITH